MRDLQRFEQLKNTLPVYKESGFCGEYLDYGNEGLLKLIEAKFDDNIKYICTNDYQGGSFGVGRVQTAKEWAETVLEWCNTDENYELLNQLILNCDEESLINEIKIISDIEIVKFDENNAEHLELLEERYNDN